MSDYIGYYVTLKTGEIEHREKRPKNRCFVSETIAHPEEQHTIHTLTLHDACGLPIRQVIMHAYNGFDRGPKHTRVVIDLLG